MSTLSYTPYAVHEHQEMLEVEYRHSDLQRSFARLMVPMCRGEDGRCPDGPELDEYILSQAPPREWFEAQEARLAGSTPTIQSVPAAFLAVVPVLPPSRPKEWYEDISVGVAEMVEGRWVRPATYVDLRNDEGNLAMLKQRLLARLAEVRFEQETGGIMIAGAQVKTDRESQSTITGAYSMAVTDPATTVEWKADNGFVTLDSETIKVFGRAVFAHVQGCFARENFIRSQIEESANVATLVAAAALLSEGWGG